MTLPIFESLPDIRSALAGHPLAVLQAPPGAGKSTGLPLELLMSPGWPVSASCCCNPAGWRRGRWRRGSRPR